MLRKFAFWLVVASLPLLAPPVVAVQLEHLYEAEVPAAGRDSAARDAALGVALREVLVRMTGSAAVLETAAAAPLLDPPGRFVEQYRFNETPASDDSPQDLTLWAQFDGVSMSRALRQAGLPDWGAQRPDVLTWLAIDDRGDRSLVSESGGQEAASMVLQAARRRGLAVTLPLLDVEDQRALRFGDVWGGFFGRIKAASQRYQPQVILTGKVERTGADTTWRADWQLFEQGRQQSWSGRGGSLQAVLDTGVNGATERLAQRYAVITTEVGVRALMVDGVRNLADYARVSDYLASLGPVDRVDVARVTDQEIVFSLRLSADERQLQQLIALGRVLQRREDPTGSTIWRFQLKP